MIPFAIIAAALLTLILSPTARRKLRPLVTRDFPLQPAGLAPHFNKTRGGRTA